ncbi:MFS transporter [Paenarthrobacter sp. NPDC091711]|uniref:MFS transporter n=1 Tax=Paenarthrobacter sp. NPDC091711 TaxID=3364385 RepID=UPI0038162E31
MTHEEMSQLPNAVAGERSNPEEVAARVAENSPPRSPLPTVGLGFIAAYALALFGISILIMTPAVVSLALRISQIDPDNAANSYSFVAGAGALFALVANPLFGRLSDNTTSRFGMRRPWIVLGTAGGAFAAVLLALAPTVPMLFLGWALMQTLVNAALAALVAVVADQIPEEQTGLLSGIVGTMPVAAILAGSFITQLVPDNTFMIFVLPAGIAVITITVFLFVLRDRVLDRSERGHFGFKEFSRTFVVSPRKQPSFSWFLLSLFLICVGLAVVQTYLFFLAAANSDVTEDQVPTVVFYLVLVMNVISIVVSFVSGALSDRFGGRRVIFGLGGVALAGAAVVVALAPNLPVLFAGVSIAGLGYGFLAGMYIAVARTTLVDSTSNARDLGLVNLTLTLPSSLVPLAAPLLLGIGGTGDNYVALFVTGAVITLAGIPLIAKIRKR